MIEVVDSDRPNTSYKQELQCLRHLSNAAPPRKGNKLVHVTHQLRRRTQPMRFWASPPVPQMLRSRRSLFLLWFLPCSFFPNCFFLVCVRVFVFSCSPASWFVILASPHRRSIRRPDVLNDMLGASPATPVLKGLSPHCHAMPSG